ncbi:ACT domain-containing protein [Anaerococcus sp. AGMB00486]|uniref:ACT domain-containing protein n=2 Tax=Anaerococcus TaxID=165779 RepID=A0ABX2N8V3_9FIRM|nr:MULTISPECIES: ACT domain-containing protein [Anaerococcus]MDY3006581.1 ACT domain-containing protein [Anaerococcus porci]MSS77435.1 ACT domain-containing protein [Anaerococcus porci]NVF11094.1 ACT domain-containing protein [Anaerococcus faecalis]
MKAILTVIGNDKPGIVYKVSELLFKFNINILDFSQTIMDDKFVAILNVDLKESNDSFENVNKAIGKLSKEIGLDLRLQNEELFDKMARI